MDKISLKMVNMFPFSISMTMTVDPVVVVVVVVVVCLCVIGPVSLTPSVRNKLGQCLDT